MKKSRMILEKIRKEYKELKAINLSEFYNLEVLPEEIEGCINLEVLDVSYSGLKVLPSWVFKLPKLKKVSYMGCSELMHQPTDIGEAHGLESIAVGLPVGHKIPKDIFTIQSLKSLTAEGDLQKWDEAVCNFERLQVLSSFSTGITDLPQSINRLKRLKSVSFYQPLYLEDSPVAELKLESIINKLVHCTSLRDLNLNRNGIDRIPPSINLLKQLNRFSASTNKLTEIPPEIYQLTNLTELDLSVNQIRRIPQGIDALCKLKVLKLNSNWHNGLNSDVLFSAIGKLEKLQTLELWSCQSKIRIPDEIIGHPSLKVLDLDGNEVHASYRAVESLKQLKRFRVSHLTTQ